MHVRSDVISRKSTMHEFIRFRATLWTRTALYAFLAPFLVASPGRTPCPAVTIDATCFTKIHLLLLLQYLHMELGTRRVRVCYTEPLSYATAFGRALSYGIERTVYLPYQPARHESTGVGLVAFLGHERLRLERIVQELEPDVSVIVFGEPGFARNMQDYSRRVNGSLIQRSRYDGQYRLVTASTKDPFAVARMLRDEVEKIRASGYDTVYIAALGTKLQALGIDPAATPWPARPTTVGVFNTEALREEYVLSRERSDVHNGPR